MKEPILSGWALCVLSVLASCSDSPGDVDPPDAGPADAVWVPTRIVQLAVGGAHNCALLDDQSLRCWGHGISGQLGYGNTSDIGDDELPASAGEVPVGAAVQKVVAGSTHNCAILVGGTVKCWGEYATGGLGYPGGRNIGDNEPVSAAGEVDVGGTVVDIAASGNHSCAILESGGLRCWGRNDHGQLGYGHVDQIGDDETPASAGDIDVGAAVQQVCMGVQHTCVLLSGGDVRCWGDGNFGQLGLGSTDDIGDDESPATAAVVPIGAQVDLLACGAYHNCVRTTSGAVRCWGNNERGELGYGHLNNIGDDEPASGGGDLSLGSTVRLLASGYSKHTCAVNNNDELRCWGPNDFGQLGYGNTDLIGDDEVPTSSAAVDAGGSIAFIATGAAHTCIVTDQDAVRCWGYNVYGRLGLGHQTHIGDDEAPAVTDDVDVF